MRALAILCIDDESIILHAITEEIRNMVDDEIIIESALDAEEALEICEELTQEGIEIALIISDCIMPGIQGDKLLEKLHILYPKAYTVMLTGQAELDATQYAINHANLFRYMTKPWEAEDMQLTTQSALKGYLDDCELESYKNDLESKVQKRTQELQEAVDIVHEFTLYTLVDKDGVILESSKSFAALCGVSASELIGVCIFDTIQSTEDESIIVDIKKALQNKEHIQTEVQTHYLNSQSTWTNMEITPHQKENEEITFIIKRHDISEKKHIEELCDTDVLTTLYNRRFFNTILPKELSRVKREKISFAFLMIDVDNFKKYNDIYGHQKGDHALCILASVLQEVTKRGSDFAFRIGGEEFAVITSDISKENIEAFANTINEKLYEKALVHEGNDASEYLSASIGVVFYENGAIEDDLDTIIKRADDLLYKAKENGRNQVVIDRNG